MKNITVKLVVEPNVNPLQLIGGLAKLTQLRRPLGLVEPDAGLRIFDSVTAMGHTSLLESADFGFYIDGASRVFLAQITRHRMAMYMGQSQQYQDQHNFDYVVPEEIAADAELASSYEELMNLLADFYSMLHAKVGKDIARYVLPGAAKNGLFMKANLREWLLVVIPQRICRRNTPESQYVIKLICKEFINKGYYELIKSAGPACITTGKCDQGKWCCGKPYKNFDDMIDV